MTVLGWMVFGCLCCLAVFSLHPGLGLAAGAQGGEDGDVEALVAHVDARYAQIKDFYADFVQETHIQGFETSI